MFPKKFSITLRESATPKVHYSKRIPMSLIDKVKDEIGKMVDEGIIAPVDYPT